MISSKEDYLYYLECDRKKLGKSNQKAPKFFGDEIWKFQRLLRKAEYLTNCKKSKFSKMQLYFTKFKLH